MNILGVIPARYESTRFPGKPLVDIAGTPMIIRVIEQCNKSQRLTNVIVATDDHRIFDAVEQFGGNVMMTSAKHQNGTERCAEVVENLEEQPDFLINIQGDEPLISPVQIDNLCQLLIDQKPEIATIVRPIYDDSQINSSNVVKCVTTKGGRALYFSRHAIPFQRNQTNITYYQHLGIYAFQTEVLQKVVRLSPTPLETTESLEQLRWLENDFEIITIETDLPTYSVDSPEDIDIILKRLRENE